MRFKDDLETKQALAHDAGHEDELAPGASFAAALSQLDFESGSVLRAPMPLEPRAKRAWLEKLRVLLEERPELRRFVAPSVQDALETLEREAEDVSTEAEPAQAHGPEGEGASSPVSDAPEASPQGPSQPEGQGVVANAKGAAQPIADETSSGNEPQARSYHPPNPDVDEAEHSDDPYGVSEEPLPESSESTLSEEEARAALEALNAEYESALSETFEGLVTHRDTMSANREQTRDELLEGVYEEDARAFYEAQYEGAIDAIEQAYAEAHERLAGIAVEHLEVYEATEPLANAALMLELRGEQLEALTYFVASEFDALEDHEFNDWDPDARPRTFPEDTQEDEAASRYQAQLDGAPLEADESFEFCDELYAREKRREGSFNLWMEYAPSYVDALDHGEEPEAFTAHATVTFEMEDGSRLIEEVDSIIPYTHTSLYDIMLAKGPAKEAPKDIAGDLLDAKRVLFELYTKPYDTRYATESSHFASLALRNVPREKMEARVSADVEAFDPTMTIASGALLEEMRDDAQSHVEGSLDPAGDGLRGLEEDVRFIPVKAAWLPNIPNARQVPLSIALGYRVDDCALGMPVVYWVQDLTGVNTDPDYKAEFFFQPKQISLVEWSVEAKNSYPHGLLFYEVGEVPANAPEEVKRLEGSGHSNLPCSGVGEARLEALKDTTALSVISGELDAAIGTLPFVGDLWDLVNVGVGELTGKKLLGDDYDDDEKYFLGASLLIPLMPNAAGKLWKRFQMPSAENEHLWKALKRRYDFDDEEVFLAKLEALSMVDDTVARELSWELKNAVFSGASVGDINDIARKLSKEIKAFEAAAQSYSLSKQPRPTTNSGKPVPEGFPPPMEGHYYRADSSKPMGYEHVQRGGTDGPSYRLERHADGTPKVVFDEAKQQWVGDFVPRKRQAKDTVYVPEDEIEAKVFIRDELIDNPGSSFHPYHQALDAEGLLDNVPILKALEHVGYLGRDLEKVRHDLKKVYEERLIERMLVDDAGALLSAEQSHAKMLDITRDLNNKDRGNLGERWYQRQYLQDGAKAYDEVYIDPDKVSVDIGEGKRYADFLNEDGEIHEVKNISGGLTKKSKTQFEVYMQLLAKEQSLTLKNGKEIQVQKVYYSLLRPEGAQANLDFFWDQMDDYDELVVRMVNKDGVMAEFSQRILDEKELEKKDLLEWLAGARSDLDVKRVESHSEKAKEAAE